MRPLLATILFAAFAASLFAADFWAKKPYTKWSVDDCERMLQDSPWAKTKTLSTPLAHGDSFGEFSDSEGATSSEISYSVQFRSAVPIREAIIRQAQLHSRYNKFTDQQKSGFDANAEKFLNQNFTDKVIVAVVFQSSSNSLLSLLRNYWERQSVATLHESVFLNAGKERLQLLGYACRDGMIQFAFPRPQRLSDEELLSVEFVHPTLRGPDIPPASPTLPAPPGKATAAAATMPGLLARLGEQRMLFEFKPAKMQLNGRLEF